MAGTPNDMICPHDTSSIWQTWFTVSATINSIILVSMIFSRLVKLISRWRGLEGNRMVVNKKPANPETFASSMLKQHVDLGPIIADALVNLSLLAGGLYLLIEVAVANPFVITSSSECPSVNVVKILSAVSIGRLCVTITATFRRLKVTDKSIVASQIIRQTLEQIFSLVVSVLILSSSQALLTKSLLLVMAADQNTFCLVTLAAKYTSSPSRGFSLWVKVVQCFLIIAFRVAVPLVCLVVSLTVYDHAMFAMDSRHVSVSLAAAVVYTSYNPYLMITTIRDMWRAFSAKENDEKPHRFFTERMNNHANLEFGFPATNRSLHIVNDLHSVIAKSSRLPPCYCKNQKNTKAQCLLCSRTPSPSQGNVLGVTNTPVNDMLRASNQTEKQLTPKTDNKTIPDRNQTKKVIKPEQLSTLHTIREETDSMVDIPL